MEYAKTLKDTVQNEFKANVIILYLLLQMLVQGKSYTEMKQIRKRNVF